MPLLILYDQFVQLSFKLSREMRERPHRRGRLRVKMGGRSIPQSVHYKTASL